MAATEAALARSLGRLNEMIEHSAVPRPALAAATAEAGAAADRYFSLLREQPDADAAPAGEAALQAQFRLLDATRDVLAETLSGRVSQARRSRDLLLALMAVLALLALGLARRVLAPPRPPDPRWRDETPAQAEPDPAQAGPAGRTASRPAPRNHQRRRNRPPAAALAPGRPARRQAAAARQPCRDPTARRTLRRGSPGRSVPVCRHRQRPRGAAAQHRRRHGLRLLLAHQVAVEHRHHHQRQQRAT